MLSLFDGFFWQPVMLCLWVDVFAPRVLDGKLQETSASDSDQSQKREVPAHASKSNWPNSFHVDIEAASLGVTRGSLHSTSYKHAAQHILYLASDVFINHQILNMEHFHHASKQCSVCMVMPRPAPPKLETSATKPVTSWSRPTDYKIL